MDSPGHSKSRSPHVTKHVRLPANGDVAFPLKTHYGLVSFSFEGVSGQVPPEGVGVGLPEYDDDDPYKSGDDPTEPQDPGGAEPTVGADATTSPVMPIDDGIDSIGMLCPSDKHGCRIISGSRRPPGAPPNTWKTLSKKDNLELSRVAEPASEAPATSSSSMLAKRIGDLLGCEIFSRPWVQEFESFVSLHGCVDPTEHRP